MLSAWMGYGECFGHRKTALELSFVTSSMVLEDPDRIHVIVSTRDEEQIALLKSYNTEGVRMEIEYSAGDGTEE